MKDCDDLKDVFHHSCVGSANWHKYRLLVGDNQLGWFINYITDFIK